MEGDINCSRKWTGCEDFRNPQMESKFTKEKLSAKRRPVALWRRFRFDQSPQVTTIKNQFILKPFQTLFEQFPVKIKELEALCKLSKYDPFRQDIITDISFIDVPKPAQSWEKTDCESRCNYNKFCTVFLTYDGFIKSNPHLCGLSQLLDEYYSFYSTWSSQIRNVMKLLSQPIQEENNLDSEINDAAHQIVEETTNKILGKFVQKSLH